MNTHTHSHSPSLSHTHAHTISQKHVWDSWRRDCCKCSSYCLCISKYSTHNLCIYQVKQLILL